MVTHQQNNPALQLVRLAISILSPLLVYFVIRPLVKNDVEALALAWFIPVAWTLGSSLWQRRLDVFGLLGVAAYGITLAISVIFGVGALPLKLHHALLGGVIGLVCLISYMMGKPVFLLLTLRSTKNTAHATQVEGALADPAVVKRISTITLIVGIASLANAALQTSLAILLPTGTFLVATTFIHVATLVAIVGGILIFIRVSTRR